LLNIKTYRYQGCLT